MRTRKLLLCTTTVLVINVTLYMVFKPFPTIGKLVEQTNKKIHYIRTLNTRELTVDDSYLEYLGEWFFLYYLIICCSCIFVIMLLSVVCFWLDIDNFNKDDLMWSYESRVPSFLPITFCPTDASAINIWMTVTLKKPYLKTMYICLPLTWFTYY